MVWWQGSPGWLPNTGTVHVELVPGLPDAQPGSWLRPKQYWVPSVVVTFQYSPSLSPLVRAGEVLDPGAVVVCAGARRRWRRP